MTVPAVPARFSVAENVGGEETLLFGSQFKSTFETDSVQSILCPLYSLFSGRGKGLGKKNNTRCSIFVVYFLFRFILALFNQQHKQHQQLQKQTATGLFKARCSAAPPPPS
jgi:hypothetical protein